MNQNCLKASFKLIIITTIISLTSCATIISGSTQNIRVTSEPTAANIYINNINVGVTPMVKLLKRNQIHILKLELEGYKNYETVLERKFNAWYLGNILIGGIIGLIIDPITGAIYRLEPGSVAGRYVPGTVSYSSGQVLYISITMEVDPNWTKIGQLAPVE